MYSACNEYFGFGLNGSSCLPLNEYFLNDEPESMLHMSGNGLVLTLMIID
jgi:hypothetical protein